MRCPLRLAIGTLGLAVAVYGASTLTGAWLGDPPWWERAETATEYHDRLLEDLRKYPAAGGTSGMPPVVFAKNWVDAFRPLEAAPREGREWISGGVTVAGLALLAWAVGPRKRPAS